MQRIKSILLLLRLLHKRFRLKKGSPPVIHYQYPFERFQIDKVGVIVQYECSNTWLVRIKGYGLARPKGILHIRRKQAHLPIEFKLYGRRVNSQQVLTPSIQSYPGKESWQFSPTKLDSIPRSRPFKMGLRTGKETLREWHTTINQPALKTVNLTRIKITRTYNLNNKIEESWLKTNTSPGSQE